MLKLSEEVVFEQLISDIPCRVVVGWTEYSKKEIDTYIPQMQNDGKWIDVLQGGIIYKYTQIGKDKNSVSVDQLEDAITFLNIKVKQILLARNQINELKDLKVFVISQSVDL